MDPLHAFTAGAVCGIVVVIGGAWLWLIWGQE